MVLTTLPNDKILIHNPSNYLKIAIFICFNKFCKKNQQINVALITNSI